MKQSIVALLILICFHGLSQQPVFVCDGSGGLYSLDLNNCTSRLVGKTQQIFIDIAFTPDGRFWGVNGDALYEIDTTNSSTTFIGFGGGGGTYSASLVALDDSILLGEYNDTLYGISVSTAQNYKIGIIGYEAYGDLTWLDNNLYMNATNGQLIKIILNDTYNEILSSTPVNNINNPLPAMYGLATVSLNGKDSIIGFGGPDNIDRISQTDGTYQQICESINPIGSFGAASLSFPTIFPIHLLNFSATPLNKTVNLQWQTATEINSNYFLIERSTDGTNFTTIGKQPAAGNTAPQKPILLRMICHLSTPICQLSTTSKNSTSTATQPFQTFFW